MPTIIPKGYYCPKCKKPIKKKLCDCGTAARPVPPYTVRFRWINENGEEEHKRLTGTPPWTTQSAAQKGYEEWISLHPSGKTKSQAPSFDFSSLYKEYKDYLKITVKESSFVTMTYRMEKYILPDFQNCKVTEITPPVILRWQNKLNEKDYSQKFKNELRMSFIHFFKFLKIYDISNPFEKVKGFSKAKESKNDLKYWTEKEFETFIAGVTDERFRMVFTFLYLTGCRKGEACALQWKDFDPRTHTIKIHATISKIVLKDDGDKKTVKSTPKTQNSYRSILLPQNFSKKLFEYKGSAEDEDYIFGKKDIPLPFNTLEHAFKRYIKLTGVKPIRIHDLRHSHASLLINKGDNQLATIYTIAARLGDTVDMVFKIYGHLFPSTQREIIDKLDVNF